MKIKDQIIISSSSPLFEIRVFYACLFYLDFIFSLRETFLKVKNKGGKISAHKSRNLIMGWLKSVVLFLLWALFQRNKIYE